MNTLKERIDLVKATAAARIPPEARAVMQQATQDLRQSGLLERAVRAGDAVPDFTLSDSEGNAVGLSGLLAFGPVVLSFYRGLW
jgi:hypothetical protein